MRSAGAAPTNAGPRCTAERGYARSRHCHTGGSGRRARPCADDSDSHTHWAPWIPACTPPSRGRPAPNPNHRPSRAPRNRRPGGPLKGDACTPGRRSRDGGPRVPGVHVHSAKPRGAVRFRLALPLAEFRPEARAVCAPTAASLILFAVRSVEPQQLAWPAGPAPHPSALQRDCLTQTFPHGRFHTRGHDATTWRRDTCTARKRQRRGLRGCRRSTPSPSEVRPRKLGLG